MRPATRPSIRPERLPPTAPQPENVCGSGHANAGGTAGAGRVAPVEGPEQAASPGRGRLGLILGSAVGDLAALAAQDDVDVVVRIRHGDGVPAHLVDHAANCAALVDAGCDRVLALHSVGSLRADWPVGTVVAPDDFFAPWATPTTFDDVRGHRIPGIDTAWHDAVVAAWQASTDHPIISSGVYAQTTGPRFETRAEIRFLATVADVVGMTLASECTIAGELGLAYASISVVDNLANGIAATPLTMDEYAAGVAANRTLLADALPRLVTALT